MRLEEVLPAFRAGNKIRRRSKTYSYDITKYYTPKHIIFCLEEIQADDWEIVEEKPLPAKTKTVWLWGYYSKSGEINIFANLVDEKKASEKMAYLIYFKISPPIEVPCDE